MRGPSFLALSFTYLFVGLYRNSNAAVAAYLLYTHNCFCFSTWFVMRETPNATPYIFYTHTPVCTQSETTPKPACGRTSGASRNACRRAAGGIRPLSSPLRSALRTSSCPRCHHQGGSRKESGRTRRARGTARETSARQRGNMHNQKCGTNQLVLQWCCRLCNRLGAVLLWIFEGPPFSHWMSECNRGCACGFTHSRSSDMRTTSVQPPRHERGKYCAITLNLHIEQQQQQ